MFLSSVFCLLFLLCILTNGDNERLDAELTISSLEMQDDCENEANAIRSSLLSNNFHEKITAQNHHGLLLRTQSNFFRKFEDVHWEIQRNWTLLVKPGDPLLSEEDWNTLVTYNVGTDELMHSITINCDNESLNCVYIKKGYEDFIENSRNQTLLKKSWQAWQTLLTLKKEKYPKVLDLVNKAALENGFQENAKSYWEMLIEQEGAYEKAESLWEQVKPLYDKLQEFVRVRLFNLYNITGNSTKIPVYLLGSNFGFDWSHIADRILPQPQAYYDAQLYLSQLTVQKIFEIAENTTKQLLGQDLGEKFWANSLFNRTFCENHIVSFCSQEHSEIFTCDKISWVTYLESFQAAMDVALRNFDYRNLPRTNLRYSVLDEALIAIGPTIAIKNLKLDGLIQEIDQNTELLLIALRVLPKLSFYLAADKWRLELLKNGYRKFEYKWWELRRNMQGVEGIFNNETDFLADSYITSNRPYLSKFLGTFLQFQLLEYFGSNLGNYNESIASFIGKDENFVMMMREKSSKDWPTLLDHHFSIYDTVADSLLSFFQPLEQYLDSAPLTQEKIIRTTATKSASKIKLEKLQATRLAPSVNESHLYIHHTVGPEPHRHFHEDLQEGDNPAMEKIGMYVGIGLLGGVVVVVLFAIASKKLTKRKQTNNRRLQT